MGLAGLGRLSLLYNSTVDRDMKIADRIAAIRRMAKSFFMGKVGSEIGMFELMYILNKYPFYCYIKTVLIMLSKKKLHSIDGIIFFLICMSTVSVGERGK